LRTKELLDPDLDLIKQEKQAERAVPERRLTQIFTKSRFSGFRARSKLGPINQLTQNCTVIASNQSQSLASAEEGTLMRRDTRKLVKAAFATVLGVLSVPDALSA
jgi:hypothetical protein